MKQSQIPVVLSLALAVLMASAPAPTFADMGSGIPMPQPGEPGYIPQPPAPPPPPPQPNATLLASIGVSPVRPTVGDVIPFEDLAFTFGWDWYLEEYVPGPPVTITSTTPEICVADADELAVEYLTIGSCRLIAVTTPLGRFTRVQGQRNISQSVIQGLPLITTVFDGSDVERTDGSIYVGDRLHLELPAAETRAYLSCRFNISATWGGDKISTYIFASEYTGGDYGIGCSADIIIPDQLHPLDVANLGTLNVSYSARACNEPEEGGCNNRNASWLSAPSATSYIPNSNVAARRYLADPERIVTYYRGLGRGIAYRFSGTGTPRPFTSSVCVTWTEEALERFRAENGDTDPTCADYPSGRPFSSWNPRDFDASYAGFEYNAPIAFTWDTELFTSCSAFVNASNVIEDEDGNITDEGGDSLSLAHVPGECRAFELTLPGPLPSSTEDLPMSGSSSLSFNIGPISWNERADLEVPTATFDVADGWSGVYPSNRAAARFVYEGEAWTPVFTTAGATPTSCSLLMESFDGETQEVTNLEYVGTIEGTECSFDIREGDIARPFFTPPGDNYRNLSFNSYRVEVHFDGYEDATATYGQFLDVIPEPADPSIGSAVTVAGNETELAVTTSGDVLGLSVAVDGGTGGARVSAAGGRDQVVRASIADCAGSVVADDGLSYSADASIDGLSLSCDLPPGEYPVTMTQIDRLGTVTTSEDTLTIEARVPELLVAPQSFSGALAALVAGREAGYSASSWTGYPFPDVKYQWYRCRGAGTASSSIPTSCARINGATNRGYIATRLDVGRYLRRAEIATSTAGKTVILAGSTSAVGRASSRVPLLLRAGRIAGSLRVGATLTLALSRWQRASSLAYSWYACDSSMSRVPNGLPAGCTWIGGDATLTLSEEHSGKWILAASFATNQIGTSMYYTAASTTSVR